MLQAQRPSLSAKNEARPVRVLATLHQRSFVEYSIPDIQKCYKEVLCACNQPLNAVFHLATALIAQRLTREIQQPLLDALFAISTLHADEQLILQLAAICNQENVFAKFTAADAVKLSPAQDNLNAEELTTFTQSDLQPVSPYESPLGLASLLNHQVLLDKILKIVPYARIGHLLHARAVLQGDDVTARVFFERALYMSKPFVISIPILNVHDLITLEDLNPRRQLALTPAARGWSAQLIIPMLNSFEGLIHFVKELNIVNIKALQKDIENRKIPPRIAHLIKILILNPEIYEELLLATIYLRATKMVQFLIAAGVSVKHTKIRYDLAALGTPLHLAAFMGWHDYVAMLIEAGAEVDRFSGHWCFTPLMLAALQGHAEVVKQLLNAGAPLQAMSRNGHTALRWSLCREENLAATIILQETTHAAVHAATDKNVKCAAVFLNHMQWAARHNRLRVLQLLMQTHVDDELIRHPTVIAQAAYAGHHEIVAFLLAKDAHLNGNENLICALACAARGAMIALATYRPNRADHSATTKMTPNNLVTITERYLLVLKHLVVAQTELFMKQPATRVAMLQTMREQLSAASLQATHHIELVVADHSEEKHNSFNTITEYLQVCGWLLDDLQLYLHTRETTFTALENENTAAFTECLIAEQIEKMHDTAITKNLRSNMQPQWWKKERQPWESPPLITHDERATFATIANKLKIPSINLITHQINGEPLFQWSSFNFRMILKKISNDAPVAHRYLYELIAAKMRSLLVVLESWPRRGLFGTKAKDNISEGELTAIKKCWSAHEQRIRSASATSRLYDLLKTLWDLYTLEPPYTSALRYCFDAMICDENSLGTIRHAWEDLEEKYTELSPVKFENADGLSKYNYLAILKIILFDRLNSTGLRSPLADLPLDLIAIIFNMIADSSMNVIAADEQDARKKYHFDALWVSSQMKGPLHCFSRLLFPVNVCIPNDVKAKALTSKGSPKNSVDTLPLIKWMSERVRRQYHHPYPLVFAAAKPSAKEDYHRCIAILTSGTVNEKLRMTRMFLQLAVASIDSINLKTLDVTTQNKINCQRSLLLTLQSSLLMSPIQTSAPIKPVQALMGKPMTQANTNMLSSKPSSSILQVTEFIDVVRTIKAIVDSDVTAPSAIALCKPFQLSPYQLSAFLDKLNDSLRPKTVGVFSMEGHADSALLPKNPFVISS